MRCMFVYLQSPSSKVQTISKSDRHCSTSKSETLHCESLGAWGVGWGTLDNCRKTTKPLLKHGCFGADSRLMLVLESVWTVPLSRHYQNQHPDCAGWQTQTQQHITPCVLKGWGSKCHTPAQPTTQCPDQEKLSNVGRSRNCNSDRGTHHRQRQRHLSQTATEAPVTDSDRGTHQRQWQRHLSQRATEAPVTEGDRGTCHRQQQRHLSQTATEAPVTDDRGSCHRQRQRHLSQTATEAPVTEGTCHRGWQRDLSQTATEAPVTDGDRGTCYRQRQRHLSQTATEAPVTDSDRGTHLN